MKLSVDKTSYTPGDLVNGTIRTHPEKAIKIRSLDVHLQGIEKVVIPYGKGSISSTNEMLNTGLRLLENTILGPEDKTLPFQLQLPTNALPSYLGSFASVVWRLRVRTDIPWGSDLNDEGYLRVVIVHSEKSSPVAVENRETAPRIRLELPSNIFEPGDVIDGKITVLEPGKLRSIRVQAIQNEDATARGSFSDAHKNQNRNITQTLRLGRDGSPENCATISTCYT